MMALVVLASSLGRALEGQQPDSGARAIIEPGTLTIDARLVVDAPPVIAASEQRNKESGLRRLEAAARQPQAAARKHYWPEFALGGAIVGGVGIGAFAIVNCDANCRDDGSLGRLPPFIVAGAVAGGVVGVIVGLIVDSSRSGP
jgi:hypothetical protein